MEKITNLKLYKGSKGKDAALDFLNAMEDIRELYNDFLEIANSKSGYTEGQVREAKELTKDGFFYFVAFMIKLQKGSCNS